MPTRSSFAVTRTSPPVSRMRLPACQRCCHSRVSRKPCHMKDPWSDGSEISRWRNGRSSSPIVRRATSLVFTTGRIPRLGSRRLHGPLWSVCRTFQAFQAFPRERLAEAGRLSLEELPGRFEAQAFVDRHCPPARMDRDANCSELSRVLGGSFHQR